MYEVVKQLHSYFAYAALTLLVINILYAVFSLLSPDKYAAKQIKVALAGFISSHIQLLLGLILHIVSPNGISNISGATMKDSSARLLALEHPLINILAIALITYGYLKAKKASGGEGVSKIILIYFGAGLILLLSRIPWSIWLG
jgi:hypothetical protein